ncbi:MAG: T9SS type A sorting domain-containing protein [Bacteroidales bacterium]
MPHHLAFDSQGMVHVIFGINRALFCEPGHFIFRVLTGLVYWNEDIAVFSNDINALSPYGDPGTELVEDVNLVGWTQDINGNGEIDVLDDWGTYYIGFSSMLPQIVIDDMDQIFIVFSSVTESFNNGLQNYRHLWARAKLGNWWSHFIDLTGNLAHIFDECIVPSVASETDDYFYLVYQSDNEPGLHIRGDEDPVGDNNTVFMKVEISDLLSTGIEEGNAPIVMEDVSQNYPNPFSGTTWVNVNIRQSTSVSLEVTDMLGKVVYRIPERNVQSGPLRLAIDATGLTSGIYFYSVKAGDSVVTKKMIVE